MAPAASKKWWQVKLEEALARGDTKLDLPGNDIGNKGAAFVAEVLKSNSTLTTLNLTWNRIGDAGAASLAEALKTNSTLTTLNLEWNDIGAAGAASLAEVLKSNSTLTTLYLRDNSIGGAGAASLAEALKTNSTLTTLDLFDNNIGAAGAASLAEVLKSNSTLTTLNLWDNSIGDAGAASLAEALKTNSTLTTLNLQGSYIGDAGATSLAEVLKSNSTLTTLYLSDNGIGGAGAASLAEALKTNSTLTTLNLQGNIIGDAGATSLAEVLKSNSTLIALNLVGNRIGGAGAASLAEVLKSNSTLTVLGLSKNNIGGAGAASLAEALKTNSTLTTLYLHGNRIGDEGAASLAEALKMNSTLTTLDLGENGISNAGKTSLREALATNSTLTMLDLGGYRDKQNVVLEADNAQRQAFAEAMLGGSRPWNYAKLLLVGEGRAGKTSAVRAMLGLDFHADERSTSLAQTEVCTVNRTVAAEWQRLDLGLRGLADEHVKAIAALQTQLTPQLTPGQRSLLRDERIAYQFQRELQQRLEDGEALEAAVHAALDAASRHLSQKRAPRGGVLAGGDATQGSSMGAQRTASNPHRARGRTTPVSAARRPFVALKTWVLRSPRRAEHGLDVPQEAAPAPDVQPQSAPAPAVRRLDMEAVSKYIENGVDQSLRLLVYDLAGQTVFYALHHLFLTRNGVYLVVFDMRRLVDTGAIERVDEANPCAGSKPVYDPEGCLRFLRFWLCSIFLHAHGAAVLILGTHKDAVKDPEQHKEIEGILDQHFGLDSKANGSGALLGMIDDGLRLVHNDVDHLSFFPVDNSVRPMDPTLVRVKQEVDKVLASEEFVRRPIPLTFLELHDKLQAHAGTHRVLHRSEVAHLAQGMPAHQLEAALQLFHNLGVLTYFADARRCDRVVLDPQYLIDRLAAVIRDYDLHECKNDREARSQLGHYERLTKQGIVSQQLLCSFWEEGERTYLTSMMEELGLMSALPTVEPIEYLVPSTLPAREPSPPLQGTQECTLRFMLCGSPDGGSRITSLESKLPFLPESLWARLLGKVMQFSNILDVAGRGRGPAPLELYREWARFAYQGFYFELRRDQHEHVVRVSLQHEFPAHIAEQLRQHAADICSEWMPRLEASVWISRDGVDYDHHEVCTTLLEGQHVLGPLGEPLRREDFAPWISSQTAERYDVFISYRVASESQLARLLYSSLSQKTVGSTGRQVRVFLDWARLRTGERWDLGFVHGLATSTICVPLISYGAIEAMQTLDPRAGKDWCDNVLLEWMLTLELARAGRVRKVLPILIGKMQADGRMSNFFNDGSMGRLKDAVSLQTLASLRSMADEIHLTLSRAAATRTIKGTLKEMLKFQTTLWWTLKDKDGNPIPPTISPDDLHPFQRMCSDLVFGQLVETLPAAPQPSAGAAASLANVDVPVQLDALSGTIAGAVQQV